jgi:hypothetical protein
VRAYRGVDAAVQQQQPWNRKAQAPSGKANIFSVFNFLASQYLNYLQLILSIFSY